MMKPIQQLRHLAWLNLHLLHVAQLLGYQRRLEMHRLRAKSAVDLVVLGGRHRHKDMVQRRQRKRLGLETRRREEHVLVAGRRCVQGRDGRVVALVRVGGAEMEQAVRHFLVVDELIRAWSLERHVGIAVQTHSISTPPVVQRPARPFRLVLLGGVVGESPLAALQVPL